MTPMGFFSWKPPRNLLRRATPIIFSKAQVLDSFAIALFEELFKIVFYALAKTKNGRLYLKWKSFSL